jgi:hypothetical protein
VHQVVNFLDGTAILKGQRTIDLFAIRCGKRQLQRNTHPALHATAIQLMLYLDETGRRERAIKAAVNSHTKLPAIAKTTDFFPITIAILVVVVETNDGVKSTFTRVFVSSQPGKEVRHQRITLGLRDHELHFKPVKLIAHFLKGEKDQKVDAVCSPKGVGTPCYLGTTEENATPHVTSL